MTARNLVVSTSSSIAHGLKSLVVWITMASIVVLALSLVFAVGVQLGAQSAEQKAVEQVAELQQRVITLLEENKRLEASLNKALISEATVKEAFVKRVVEPSEQFVSAYVVKPTVSWYDHAQAFFSSL